MKVKVNLRKFNWAEKRQIKKMKRDFREFPMACLHYRLFGWLIRDEIIINKEYAWFQEGGVPFEWYIIMLNHEGMHDVLYHEIGSKESLAFDNISCELGMSLCNWVENYSEDIMAKAWEELGKT